MGYLWGISLTNYEHAHRNCRRLSGICQKTLDWRGFPQIYGTFAEAPDDGYFQGFNNPEEVIGDMMCGKYGAQSATRVVLPAG
jgi:hypothetical protein